MYNAARPIMWVIAMGLSVLGLMNVYGDSSHVEELAREAACEGCKPAMRQVARTPLGQTYRLQVDDGVEVVVSCSKSAIFVGEYSCEKN